MAKIIDGALVGKLGNIVGSSYKGRYYLKQRPVRSRPPTPGELVNQYVFALVNSWLRPIADVVRQGFQGYSPRFEGYNAAKSLLHRQGLHREGYDSYIVPSEVLVSYGSLGQSENLQAAASGDGIDFSWDPTTTANTSPRDRIVLLAYNVAAAIAAYDLSGPKRSQASAQLSLKDYPAGTYHLYAAFVAEDYTRQSTSSYLGSVESDGGMK